MPMQAPASTINFSHGTLHGVAGSVHSSPSVSSSEVVRNTSLSMGMYKNDELAANKFAFSKSMLNADSSRDVFVHCTPGASS